MSRVSHATIRPTDVLRTVLAHPWHWAGPVLVCTALAVVFAAVRPASWEATQALLVRDEAVGNTVRPGRFTHVEEMKTAQETVLELVKSRSVLAGALAAVGAPADYTAPEPWPSDTAVEALQQSIKLSPPKGAEFGKTEVFYLKVSAPEKQRAIDLAAAICHGLESHFEQLRVSKYQSVIDEMTNTVKLAQDDLTKSTADLTTVEKQAGRDLAELRTLNESPSSDSALRRMANELESELRTYRGLVNSNQELLGLLESAKDEPGRLLASPSRLLEAQPALRRLKDGLVDAQLRTAALLGTMSPDHPAAQAAKVGEQEIGAHLGQEIAIATKGLEIDLRLAKQRVAALEQQRLDLQDRLLQLANVRAEYSNLVLATKHRADILKTAQQELSEAQAGQAAARTSSLITLIDAPDAGSKPSGPGRTTIVLAGFMAGVCMALGILFLTIQPSTAPELSAAQSLQGAVAPAQEIVTAPVAMIEPQSVAEPAELDEPKIIDEPKVAAEIRTVVEPKVVIEPKVIAEPKAIEPRQPQPVAVSPAPARTKGTPAAEPVPAGSLSLKRALQKLDAGQSAWN